MAQRCPQLPYVAQTCPQNIYIYIYVPKSVFGYVITFLKLATKHFAHVVQNLDSLLAQGSDDPTLSLFMIVAKLLFLVRRLKAWVLM